MTAFTAQREATLQQLEDALHEASRRLREAGPQWETTQAKIAVSKTSWLVAGWREPPDARYAAPPRPLPCVVFAADGSQIAPDRHDITDCYVLNVGLITLRYGTGERAVLTSRPNLFLPDDDLQEVAEDKQEAMQARRLGIRRQLEEISALGELTEQAGQTPALALCDGSLILWTLEGEQEEFRGESLAQFAEAMEAARKRRVPLIGYISNTRSRDVINALRIQACPHEEPHCDRHCPSRIRVRPECSGVERVRDVALFERLLKPGERSAVFEARTSKILSAYLPAHKIYFFYLHTGAEIARIEIPAWVADDAALLEQTHALCCDQTQKGDGYPVALAEAHEQAVIRGAERDTFYHLMDQKLVRAHQSLGGTRKALSKRSRRV